MGRRARPQTISSRVYKAYINGEAWKKKADACRKRAKYRCEHCGKKGVLHAHHLTYERFGNELPDDLRALCVACHDCEHNPRAKRRRQREARTYQPKPQNAPHKIPWEHRTKRTKAGWRKLTALYLDGAIVQYPGSLEAYLAGKWI